LAVFLTAFFAVFFAATFFLAASLRAVAFFSFFAFFAFFDFFAMIVLPIVAADLPMHTGAITLDELRR
jgi:hypothetical protein